jgi:Domain of unknown function (DUF4224)
VNTEPLCLTDAELSELTGKQRPSAQMRALRFMAIDHKRRPDGSIVVLRFHLVASADKNLGVAYKRTEPNWN